MSKILNDLVMNLKFIVAAYIAYCLGLPMIKLLELTGRFQEIHLEPFPDSSKKKQGLIIVTNHPDGNEWFFIYRHFFRWIQLIAPWVLLENFPFALVDRTNFYASRFTRLFQAKLVAVDRESGRDTTRTSSLRRTIELLRKGKWIVSFFEGTRTNKANALLFSKRGKRLGKLEESLGSMVAFGGAVVKPGWFEYSDCSFSSLPWEGGFDLKRFLKWYWLTLRGKNGKAVLVWGKIRDFSEMHGLPAKKQREMVTATAENDLLELADQAIGEELQKILS